MASMSAKRSGGGRPNATLLEGELPRRLRAERERRSISVRELARRLGVSPSAISQIETGRARPSVSTLYAIVSELGMSLDELFGQRDPRDGGAQAAAPSAGGPSSPVGRPGSRSAIELETGVRWERLTASPDPEVDFLLVTYPAGSSSSATGALQRHEGREYGLVLSGNLEVVVGFDTYELGPRDSISFDSMVPHRLRNAGQEPVTGVWVVIGRGAGDRRAAGLAEADAPGNQSSVT